MGFSARVRFTGALDFYGVQTLFSGQGDNQKFSEGRTNKRSKIFERDR